MAKPGDGAVRRRIYFYQLDAGLEPSGKRIPFDVRPALKAIDALPFGQGGRYMDNGDGNTTCAWVDRVGDGSRMRLATIRKTELPQVEAKGRLADLTIPIDGGLVEATHLMFFPDNVLGAEFNFYGPRASRLREYFRTVADGQTKGLEKVRLLGLDNVFDQVKRMKELRLLRSRASPSYAATLARVDGDLARAVEACAAVGGPDQVGLSLSVAPRAKRHLGAKLLDTVKGLTKNREITPEGVSQFEVKGYTDLDRLETIDLLKEFLVSEQKVTKVAGRSRAYVSESVYAAIEQAHDELKHHIRNAIDL